MRHRVLSIIFVASLASVFSSASRAEDKPATPVKRPTTAPASIPTAIDKGVRYLIKTQTKEGFWGTGTETRGFEVYSMVPGSHDAYRVGTTALCVMALREAGEKEAHKKGLEWLIAHGEAKRDDGALLYNIWAHIYGLQAMAMEMRQDTDPRLRTAAVYHLKQLGKYETYMGGWNYYDFQEHTQAPSMGPTSFSTAAGLVALCEAKKSGIDVPQKMIDMCIKRLSDMRLPNNAYLYGADYQYKPRLPANQPRGSVGRTQSCNYALWLAKSKDMDEKKVRQGLDFFFKEHIYIDMGRKRQFPHESWYQTAPYYYYFGHYYTGLILEKLGPEGKKEYGRKLAEVGILPNQEPDGSWWDFAMWDYHKPYGTAYAIMVLLRCE